MLDNSNSGHSGNPTPNALDHGGNAPSRRTYGYGMGYRFATAGEEHDDIDLRQLVFLLYRYRWLIALFVCVGLVAGLMATWAMTPKYRSTTQLEIVAPSAKVLEELEVVSTTANERAFHTAREKLMSRSLAQRVVFDLGLDTKADFLFPAADFAPSNFLNRALGRTLSTPLEDVEPEKRTRIAVSHVQKDLSVELLGKTSLVGVTYSHQDPRYAQMVAEQVARSFIDHGVDQTSETSVLARQFIEEQVKDVRARLQASERALVDYARQEGLTLTGDESSLIAGNINQINKAISGTIEQRLNYGLLVTEIDQGRGASLPEVLNNDGIQKLRDKVATLSAEYQHKLSAFRPDFPDMRQLKAQIDELERQIASATAVITRSVRLRHSAAITREADLRSKLEELEAAQATFQEKNIQYTILKREVDSNRSQYKSLIEKRNAVGVGSALKTHNAVVVDPAVLPRSPYSPRLGLNLGVAFGLSAVLAAMVIFLRELLHDVFSSPDQVERDLELPLLGILPDVSLDEIGSLVENRNGALLEAVRSLRTSLQFSGQNGEPRSLILTSTEPGEGKSTITANLALEFAALGRSVLLVDADFRKPSQHRLFNTDNTMGLSNLLAGKAGKEDMSEIFRKTATPNLMLMTAGSIARNPPDLLISSRMSRLIRICAEKYDLVIFDSPPVLGLSDALILSRICESTAMVVCADRTRRRSALAALGRLQSAGGNLIGAVINRFHIDYYAYSAYGPDSYAYGDPERQIADETGSSGKGGNAHAIFTKVKHRICRVGKLLRFRLDRAG